MSIFGLLFLIVLIWVGVTLALKWLTINVVGQRIIIFAAAVISLLLIAEATGLVPPLNVPVPRLRGG